MVIQRLSRGRIVNCFDGIQFLTNEVNAVNHSSYKESILVALENISVQLYEDKDSFNE